MYLFADKLWPSDKYGFKLAYAIKLNNTHGWIIKKSGQEWEQRKNNWSLIEETWSKYILPIIW